MNLDEPVPGDLDKRIRVRTWLDVPNAAYGLDQTFPTDFNCWAAHEPVHGLANRAAAQTSEAPTDIFFIRARTGTDAQELTNQMVIEFRSHRYRIVDAIPVGTMRRFTRITAKDLGVIA